MCQLPQTKPDNKSDNGYSNRLMRELKISCKIKPSTSENKIS